MKFIRLFRWITLRKLEDEMACNLGSEYFKKYLRLGAPLFFIMLLCYIGQLFKGHKCINSETWQKFSDWPRWLYANFVDIDY